MFTTHTESTQNFWTAGLEQIEKYTDEQLLKFCDLICQDDPTILSCSLKLL